MEYLRSLMAMRGVNLGIILPVLCSGIKNLVHRGICQIFQKERSKRRDLVDKTGLKKDELQTVHFPCAQGGKLPSITYVLALHIASYSVLVRQTRTDRLHICTWYESLS
jgi:hypothetical protein